MKSAEVENEEDPKQIDRLLQDCGSEVGIENTTKKILAAIIVMSNVIVVGKVLGYSAILIPQLLDDNNNTKFLNGTEVKSNTIYVTESDISWIASAMLATALPISLIGGLMIESFGRLNTIKFSAIPNAIGWIVIATAKTASMVIVGRILTGTTLVLAVSPTVVYVTEISSPRIRGALVSVSLCYISLGIMLVYVEGWFLKWNTVAWCSLVYIMIPTAVTFWLPESPVWLISKNRILHARKSIEWLNNTKPKDVRPLTLSEIQPSVLINGLSLVQTGKKDSWRRRLQMIFHPTAYKPFVILMILVAFQQLSGIFLVLFYAVSLFREMGINISAYLATALVGLARFVMTFPAVYLLKNFGRRNLILISSLGMSVSMALSGLFVTFIKEGRGTASWIPVSLVLVYVASTVVGVLTVPWTMASEIFPTEIRGIATSLCWGLSYLLMFGVTWMYFPLIRLVDGVVNLQYFFAIISFLCSIYNYIFLPETHNKELSEIQEYFKNYWLYISFKRSENNEFKNKASQDDAVLN